MTLTREEIADGLIAEYDSFARLIVDLDSAQCRTPMRCTGWEYETWPATWSARPGRASTGRSGSTPDEQARRHRETDPSVLAQRLRDAAPQMGAFLGALDDETWAAPSGVGEMTIGEGIHTMWYDAYVHADDIRAGERAAREHGVSAAPAAARRLGAGASRARRDGRARDRWRYRRRVPVLRGDPLRFVLVASGRAELGLDESVNVYRR